MPGNPFGDEFMRRFFGRYPQEIQRARPRLRRRRGSGGLHPDEQPRRQRRGQDHGQALRGRPEPSTRPSCIGADPDTDLALIKIEAHGLKAATLGDSSKMEVGDWVIAVGNPFGLDHTVTSGIVSAMGRRIGLATYENLIQTDAAINPGNSGGPLANIQGEVIGINAAITSPSGAFAGIGLAIPSNTAKKVLAALRSKGKVTRGFLGVEMQTTDARVGQVARRRRHGRRARRAGQRRFSGREGGLEERRYHHQGRRARRERPRSNCRRRSASMSPGDKVSVEIVRDGKTQTVEVVLGERTAAAMGEEAAPAAAFLGITVQDLTPEIAAQLGYKMNQGVLVSAVAAGCAADQAGIKPGSLIEEVARKEVHNVDEYNAAVEAARSLPMVALRVRSGKSVAYMVLPTK